MKLKGYPLFWYMSSMGKVQFYGVQSKTVRKVFPLNRHLNFMFYGLSNNISTTLSWSIGINSYVSFDELGYAHFIKLNYIFLKQNKTFGYKLKEKEIQTYKRLFKIKCRRGRRLLQGLPVRGQSTHTNAITCAKHSKQRKKEVFSEKKVLVGTRAERKARYYALQERKKALRLRASRQKVRALLREAKRKRKLKEKARAWIMSKQKKQMERARKKWQAVAAKKRQQRMRQW